MEEKNTKNKKTFLSIKSENYYNILKLFGIKLKIPRQKKYKNISILLNPEAGLGNRLNSLVFAILYDNPQKLFMHWDTNGWVTKSFKDLFNFNYPVQIIETNDINEVSKEKERDNMKNAIIFTLTLSVLIINTGVTLANIPEPQWSEFCPYKYQNAELKETYKINNLSQFLLGMSIVGIPIAMTRLNKYYNSIENNYWANRKNQFLNEVATCSQYKDADGKLTCYLNVRQFENSKNYHYQQMKIAEENLRLQRINNIQMNNLNNNLQNIDSNLDNMNNYTRYGY